MPFAQINPDLSYWKKQSQPLFPDLAWNIPEQKSGRVAIIGGNANGFSNIVRLAEFMNRNFPFATLTTLLPDTLRDKLPNLPNLEFALSTSSGSFAKSALLRAAFDSSDAVLLAGDLSRNSETAIALAGYINPISSSASEFKKDTSGINQTASDFAKTASIKPLILTRDAVDLLAPEAASWLLRPATFIVASMLQLQKLFRAVYYPRMILLSQPLLPVLETLHKFTLTYPVTLLTFHETISSSPMAAKSPPPISPAPIIARSASGTANSPPASLRSISTIRTNLSPPPPPPSSSNSERGIVAAY